MMKAFAAAFAMLVGGLIYVLWREQGLLMFAWFSDVGLSPQVATLRNAALPLRPLLPSWLLYSLPEALWLLSGLLALDVIWGTRKRGGYLFWTVCLATMAIGSEVGQFVRVVPGRFDPVDLALMLVSCGMGGFFAGVGPHSLRGLLCGNTWRRRFSSLS
jgi:hypothetical protein